MTKKTICLSLAWSVSLATVGLAIVAWGSDWRWHITSSPYQIFPLLGLSAYGLMWSHYAAAAVRQLLGQPKQLLQLYFETTSIAVLILIAMHPSLLIYQRFRDGFGLPPHSYESYVAPGLGWVTLLATACLLIFLFYELRRLFGQRSWWQYAQMAVDLAMLGIFYHALRLGTDIHGWFRGVWWFYGLSLVVMLAVTYSRRYIPSKPLSR